MKVLSTPEFNEVIAWTSSGKAFNILLPKVFCSKILPDHFKSAKYSSFTRKLHRWGFMRHYRGGKLYLGFSTIRDAEGAIYSSHFLVFSFPTSNQRRPEHFFTKTFNETEWIWLKR
jgi:HSF-type DNA-binding